MRVTGTTPGNSRRPRKREWRSIFPRRGQRGSWSTIAHQRSRPCNSVLAGSGSLRGSPGWKAGSIRLRDQGGRQSRCKRRKTGCRGTSTRKRGSLGRRGTFAGIAMGLGYTFQGSNCNQRQGNTHLCPIFECNLVLNKEKEKKKKKKKKNQQNKMRMSREKDLYL